MKPISRPLNPAAQNCILALGFVCLTTFAVPGTAYADENVTLKSAFQGSFLVGAALNQEQLSGRDARSATLVRRQFNTISPENALKWEVVHPEPGRDGYDFGPADRFVEFGEANDMFMVGHTLVWHSQTPRWVFEDENGKPTDRETLLARMREHIHTVVGRYQGRIHGWDVVNEALNEDGTLRGSPWMRIIGEDYLEKAFQFAHEADPEAELYYNDHSLENKPKRNGAVRLVEKLQEQGVPVTGIGIQAHVKMHWPSPQQVEDTIMAFSKLGKIMFTELDVDVLPAATRDLGADVGLTAERRQGLDPYKAGLPDPVQQALARRYGELFAVFVKHRDKVSRVTFWGVTDGDSWLNHWPIRGRTSYPLLFDRDYQPKPAFNEVIQIAP